MCQAVKVVPAFPVDPVVECLEIPAASLFLVTALLVQSALDACHLELELFGASAAASLEHPADFQASFAVDCSLTGALTFVAFVVVVGDSANSSEETVEDPWMAEGSLVADTVVVSVGGKGFASAFDASLGYPHWHFGENDSDYAEPVRPPYGDL